MSGSISGVGGVPAAAATDAGQPNQAAWNTAAGAATGGTTGAAAAEQNEIQTEMVGQIGMMTMMPLIMQAMNAGQDDG